MPYFSKKSLDILYTCDQKIVLVMSHAIKIINFSVLEGLRTLETQKRYLKEGKTKTLKSKHLCTKITSQSRAVDILPFPFGPNDWGNRERFSLLAGVILGTAESYGISMRWGGDWDKTWDPKKTKFYDAIHFELI